MLTRPNLSTSVYVKLVCLHTNEQADTDWLTEMVLPGMRPAFGLWMIVQDACK